MNKLEPEVEDRINAAYIIISIAMVVIECPMGDTCDYKTQDFDMDNAMVMLQMHSKMAHQQGLGEAPSEGKTGKIVRPRLELKDSYVD